MKRNQLLVLALLSAAAVQAQDTYFNDQQINNTNDVIGTARYVGMGGAMGALGADLSTISWNPAGLGLYRKNDVAITFGGLWNKSKINEENRGKGTFDQAGFVYSMSTGDDDCPYLNFGFNYQKKINFNSNYYADNDNLKSISQMDQLAELATNFYDTDYNIAGLAYDLSGIVDDKDKDGNDIVVNNYRGDKGLYTHHSQGSLQGYEINFSANIKNRGFVGMTVGVDNMQYRGWSEYTEIATVSAGNYTLYNDYKITGYGVNVKLGTIVRPIEDNPFRIGFVVETPTWYRLKNSTLYDFTPDLNYESYLEYNLRTPWKLRASLGSTVGTSFAWDVDYEWANYSATSMGYPDYDEMDDFHSSFTNTKDQAMNRQTKDNLKSVHTLRAGMEYRPTSHWALRIGYNFVASAYKKDITFDQYSLNSAAMDYSTGTSFMRLKPTNILTLGAGYRTKNFYVDLAYKVRNQKADFYAFDDSFTAANTTFSTDNPTLAGTRLDPTEVDLTRQSITCTLGLKF